MVCEKSHNRVKCQSMHMLCCGVRFTSFFSAEETVVETEEALVEVGGGEWWQEVEVGIVLTLKSFGCTVCTVFHYNTKH